MNNTTEQQEANKLHSGICSGEELAAISMAMYEHMNKKIHDIEHTTITIKTIIRPYSAWSSKILTVREIPGRK